MLRVRLPVAVFALCLPLVAAAAAAKPEKAVVAYLFPQDGVLQPGQVDALSLTRINYAFANIADGRMVKGFSHDDENYAFLVALKKQNPSLTVLVSVGGWLWSTDFSDVSLTQKSREVFIQSVMEFLEKYHLDGLDIDWEFPNSPGAGHPYRREDKQNFTLLIKELRARFDKETARTHERLYLTIAAGADNEFLTNTEMAEAQRYLDSVNLMCYDYYEPGSEPTTGNHAPLFVDPADPRKVSAAASIDAYLKAGVPPEKLVLGMPFYGHVWGEVPDVNHGLFQPGKPVPHAWARYSGIPDLLKQGYVRYWDSAASVPYLYNSDKRIFVSYEDPQSVAAKCNYVLLHHLGGVMFWEYTNDPSGALLHTIRDAFHPPSQRSDAKP